MGGGIRVRDAKTIKEHEISLKQSKWWDDRGRSGIECKIYVEVRKGDDFFVSDKITINHAQNRDLDNYYKDADTIKDIRVDSDHQVSVLLSGEGRSVNDFWVRADKI